MTSRGYSSIDEILTKLVDVARNIRRRQCLKRLEIKNTVEALTLLQGRVASGRKEAYLKFLEDVRGSVGLYGVVLCAAALGKTAVITMKSGFRKELPAKMKERETELCLDNLQQLDDIVAKRRFPPKKSLEIYVGLFSLSPMMEL